MKKILINGFSSNTGGGKTILENYTKSIIKHNKNNKYYIVISYQNTIRIEKTKNLELIIVSKIINNKITSLYFYLVYLNFLIFKYKIDVVFNLGDLILPILKKQIYFFDWAYLVCEDKKVWNKMYTKDYLSRKFKIFLIKSLIKTPKLIIAQTEVMKNKLISKFSLQNVVVIPTPINKTNNMKYSLIDFKFKKLLFLSTYAPHKNFEIIYEVLKLIKSNKLEYCMLTTLPKDKFSELFSKDFLTEYKEYIYNLSEVKYDYVYSLINQCDALFLPTLLESYGLPYYEAMINNTPIITSNYDFAVDACKESAYYFDPLNPKSIVDILKNSFLNEDEKKEKLFKAKEIVCKLPSWRDTFFKFENQILRR